MSSAAPFWQHVVVLGITAMALLWLLRRRVRKVRKHPCSSCPLAESLERPGSAEESGGAPARPGGSGT